MKVRTLGSFVAGAALIAVAVGFTFMGSLAQDEPTMFTPPIGQPGPGPKPGQMMQAQPNFRPMMGGGIQMAANANAVFILEGSRLIKVDAATLRVISERAIPQLRGPMDGQGDFGERTPGRGPVPGRGGDIGPPTEGHPR